MLNIKEIALEAGHSTVPAYWLSDEKPIACSTSNFEKLVSFAEALIAEIAKQNEPVAWAIYVTGDLCDVFQNKDFTLLEFNRRNKLYPEPSREFRGLFTFPPTAEQIANETAEACAKMLESGSFLTPESRVALAANGAAKAIRNGAWKEFK